MMLLRCLPLFFLFVLCPVSAADAYFPKTPVGRCEIKVIPPATLIQSRSEQGYFSANNGLFRPLFAYIRKQDIAMTTPVEAEIEPGRMSFYIGAEAASRDLPPSDEVRVLRLPARTVASIGVRGSYSPSNFAEAEAKLRAWLAAQPTYEVEGPARAVFWDGPFTPGFLKRFEVHLLVRAQAASELVTGDPSK